MIDSKEKLFNDSKINMRDIIALFVMNGMLAQHKGTADGIVVSSYSIADEFIKCSKNFEKYSENYYESRGLK